MGARAVSHVQGARWRFSCPPILFVVLTFLLNFVPGTNPTLPVLFDCIPHIAILLLAIKKVILPSTPEQAWGQSDLSEDLEHIMWNRSLLDMVSQSNIAFGVLLVDALWSAENYKMQKLRELSADPSAAERLLQLCKSLEVLEREEGASDTSDTSDELEAELKPIASGRKQNSPQASTHAREHPVQQCSAQTYTLCSSKTLTG
mmetsp:Transcript_25710/g.51844  ORF Transcript_25710/g.51844 Transcript_25710/m.51844 type:complete len:203 (-) Transcript_25710:76-684(-)